MTNNPPNINKTIMIGANQNFFLTFKNLKISNIKFILKIDPQMSLCQIYNHDFSNSSLNW